LFRGLDATHDSYDSRGPLVERSQDSRDEET